MSGRTVAPDAAWVEPDEQSGPEWRAARRAARRERLLELAPHALVTMATLVSALSARGPGGRLVTPREARRLLTEATALAEMLRQTIGTHGEE
jgi:hypothetical protein